MSPGGVMLADDISTHQGFAIFARRHPEYQTIVCPSADRLGLFGIAINSRGRTGLGRSRAGVPTPTVAP